MLPTQSRIVPVMIAIALSASQPIAFAKNTAPPERAGANHRTEGDLIDEGSNLNFVPNLAKLGQEKLQIAVQRFTAEEFRRSPYRSWDRDNFTAHMQGEDFVSVVKSATIYRGRLPEFFRAENVMTKRYLKTVLDCDRMTAIDAKALFVDVEKTYYFIHTVASTVNFGFYDYTTQQGRNYTPQQAEAVLTAYGISDRPERMMSTNSVKEKISFGSYGARTTNFYYRLNDSDTLHVSYKVLSVKKEEKYSSFLWRTLGVWHGVVGKFRDELVTGTLRCAREVAGLPKGTIDG